MLMRHRRATEAILDELRRTCGNSENRFAVDYDLIHSSALPYTMATFYETIRLFPPVPVELKECTKSTTFPDGTSLPEGAIVMWVPWAMGRSRGIWGRDADLFRPERWLGHDGNGAMSLLTKTAFEYPVFNGGPRSCLGKRMAELLSVAVITALIWRYRFEEAKDLEAVSKAERRSKNSLTLPMEGGLPCRVFHAHDQIKS